MGIAEARRIARELALLTVYCKNLREAVKIDQCKQEVFELIDEEEIEVKSLDEETLQFLDRIIEAFEMHKKTADELINKHLEGWEIERMNVLDLSILELAVCELLGINDVGYKITISEAVNLSKKYSSSRAPFLINAVLDSIANTLGLKA
ncbi:MAG: transcription antitermination factor NusB [candidate division WOR-3 bacterium]